jgi:hypothetical protein
MIREKTRSLPCQTDPDDAIHNPQVQYNMGKTQNSPVHLPTFLQKNDGDPAITVSSFVFLPAPTDIAIRIFSQS